MLDLLNYEFFQNALISTILISICCGLLGTYIVARRMVFISGGITHSSFGGLGIAYYLGLNPLIGATVFALLSSYSIVLLGNKKIREDSLIGILWSVGMAIGVFFIYITPGFTPNLISYLFGDILTVSTNQIILLGILCIIIIIFFKIMYRPIFYIAFDREYSKTHSSMTHVVEYLMMTLITLCIVLSIKLAGIILIISYLTLPQSIAGLFVKNFSKQFLLSTILSFIGSIIGLFVSALTNIPSGATIVLVFLSIFIISYVITHIINRNPKTLRTSSETL